MVNTINAIKLLDDSAEILFKKAQSDDAVLSLERNDIKKLEKDSTECLCILYKENDIKKLAQNVCNYLTDNNCRSGVLIIETPLELSGISAILELKGIENISEVTISCIKTNNEDTIVLCIGYR